jgi:protein-tyrosine-phosphatase
MTLRAMASSATWRLRSIWAMSRARGSSRIALVNGRPQRILVVCYGNIYRSAFVAAQLRLLAPALTVRSAGFHPTTGRPAPDRHVTMARTHGVELSAHASSLIGPGDREWADIVVMMDRSNWVKLRRMGFEAKTIVWLGALVPGSIEIRDPYAMDDESAATLLRRIAKCTERLASALNEPALKLE